jgi:two-component system OmpR family sensor kinase
MSLRARLVSALAALLVIGLGAFGVATYARYSRAENQRLDTQLRSAVPTVSRQLTDAYGLDNHGGGHEPGHGDGDNAVSVSGFTGLRTVYAELRSNDGTVVARLMPDGQPSLPSGVVAVDRAFTVSSSDGSGHWRVVSSRAEGPNASSYSVILGTPNKPVTDSLRELLLIEAVAGLILLVVLMGGSWLIIRQGLRPIEAMSQTARQINEGDLSMRVSTEKTTSEIGELGHALNSMLDGIEQSFKERDETEQRLRRFLSDASHELRTPLTSIQGFAELFRLGQGTNNEHIDQSIIMRRIEEESARMKTLVEDLLLLARLDETRRVEFAPVDLAVLAADACSDAVAADPIRAVSLDAPSPVVVQGDAGHLRQAVANLVANAIKHTPTSTSLELGARIDGDHARFSIRDHGPGLAPEALSHVFERFWQADSARVGTGAGLGLSIVDSIAREHGGRAVAENMPDGGARFTLVLPLTPPVTAPTGGTLQKGSQ